MKINPIKPISYLRIINRQINLGEYILYFDEFVLESSRYRFTYNSGQSTKISKILNERGISNWHNWVYFYIPHKYILFINEPNQLHII